MIDTGTLPQWIASIAGSASAIAATITYINARIGASRTFARSIIVDVVPGDTGDHVIVELKNLSDQVITDIRVYANGSLLPKPTTRTWNTRSFLEPKDTVLFPIDVASPSDANANRQSSLPTPTVVVWFIDVRGTAWNLVLGQPRPKRKYWRPFMKQQ